MIFRTALPTPALSLLALLLLSAAPLSADGTIQSVVGTSSQNGILATAAQLSDPEGLAADGVGNIYVSDFGNNVINQIGVDHIIRTVAGTGNYVISNPGDGPALTVDLNGPSGLSYVNAGPGQSLLFFCDTLNNLVRQLNLSTGMITTVAGSAGGSGSSVDGQPPLSTILNNPYSVCALINGDIFIADTFDHAIRYFNLSGTVGVVNTDAYTPGLVTTVAGTLGTIGYAGDLTVAAGAQLNTPYSCWVYGSILYIADSGNNAVRSVSLTTGMIYTYAGDGTGNADYTGDGGPASSATFDLPDGVATDSLGNLFVADFNNLVVRKVSASSGVIVRCAGTGYFGSDGDGGAPTAANMGEPSVLALDSNDALYVGDYSNQVIRNVNPALSIISTFAGSGNQEGVKGTQVQILTPWGMRFSPSGILAFMESGGNKIRTWDPQSGILRTLAGTGSLGSSVSGSQAVSATVAGLRGVAYDSLGNLFFTQSNALGYTLSSVNAGSGLLTVWAGDTNAAYTGDTGTASLGEFGDPEGVCVMGSDVFVADAAFNVIRVVNTVQNRIYTLAGSAAGSPGYAGDGAVAGPATRFNTPLGMDSDTAGNIYIADSGNHCIRKIAFGTNIVSTVAGKGPTHGGYSGDGLPPTQATLDFPADVDINALGDLYIADAGDYRIRRVSGGLIGTVAGTGIPGFSGDGGPANQAQIELPEGVAADATGSVYFSDTLNDRVRKVDFSLSPTPTPVSKGGSDVVAYPSPADKRICFSYQAANAGKMTIQVYNSALQNVATINDDALAGFNTTCNDVAGLVSGAYFYRLSIAGMAVGKGKFKVLH